MVKIYPLTQEQRIAELERTADFRMRLDIVLSIVLLSLTLFVSWPAS